MNNKSQRNFKDKKIFFYFSRFWPAYLPSDLETPTWLDRSCQLRQKKEWTFKTLKTLKTFKTFTTFKTSIRSTKRLKPHLSRVPNQNYQENERDSKANIPRKSQNKTKTIKRTNEIQKHLRNISKTIETTIYLSCTRRKRNKTHCLNQVIWNEAAETSEGFKNTSSFCT